MNNDSNKHYLPIATGVIIGILVVITLILSDIRNTMNHISKQIDHNHDRLLNIEANTER